MSAVVVLTRSTSNSLEYGGHVWVRLQYVLGLKALGHDVLWLDQVYGFNSENEVHSREYVVRAFSRLCDEFQIEDTWCIDWERGSSIFGKSADDLERILSAAELLIFLGGDLEGHEKLPDIPLRAIVDLDPGFTQLWDIEWDLKFDRFTHWLTVGQNVGESDFIPFVATQKWFRFVPPVYLNG